MTNKTHHNKTTPTSRATKERMMMTREAMDRKSNNHQEKSVSTNSVDLKKYTKSYVPKSSMPNTASCVNHAMKVMSIMTFVNFVNRSTLVQEIQKMMINGLDVISVIDGYVMKFM